MSLLSEEAEAVFLNLGISAVIDDLRYDSHSLALEASRRALEQMGFQAEEVDLLILLRSRVTALLQHGALCCCKWPRTAATCET